MGDGQHAEGNTAAVEGGDAWTVDYEIDLDARWLTRTARVRGRSAVGVRERAVASDGAGRWLVDGAPAQYLDGCMDVDLESSCLTNAFPVHRLRLAVGEEAEAPAAYVRAVDLSVERLDQHYTRLGDSGGRQRYHYAAPAFGFECELAYDGSGLLLDYPGIGSRVA